MARYGQPNYWENLDTRPKTAISKQQASSRFNLFDKDIDTRELIRPVLGRWDKEDLWTYVNHQINAKQQENPQLNGATNAAGDHLTEQKIPKFLIYDIYNKYYAAKQDMEIKKPTEGTQWLYDFIKDKLNTFYTKPMTEQNMMNSAIYTGELAYTLLKFDEQENPQGQGGGGDGNSSIQQSLQNAGPGAQNKLKKEMQKAADNAQKKIDDLQDMMDNAMPDENDGSEGPGNEGGGDSAGDGSNFTINEAMRMEQFYSYLNQVDFNESTFANFFKDTLKMSQAYFGGKYKEEEHSLFDVDDIEELSGIENLLPQLKSIHMEDVVTHTRKYFLKFDVYLDISGSMGDMGNSSSKLMMGKLTGLKLARLKLVDNFYCFDTRITHKMKALEFLKTNSRGGTSIETVIQKVKELQRPSLIITDASDSIQTHDPNCYFVGVPGASFGRWNHGETAQYFTDQQLVVMQKDGTLKKADPDDMSYGY
jgi:hypothetical protein